MNQEEIAKALNLSKTTVSRALSGKGRVSGKTRERVLEFIDREEKKKAIEEGGLTRNICVAIPGDEVINANSYFSDVLFGVCDALSLVNYNVLVVKITENDISAIENVVKEKKANGIILTRSMEHDRALNYLSSINFPSAVAGHTSHDNIISVDIDNEKAMEELTSLLIAKGYRNFTCVVEDLHYMVNINRRDGFNKAIEKMGLSKDKQILYTGTFNPDVLPMIASNVLSKKTDCIICGDDELAVKIMSWLKNEGYRIPMDVAIASCYNSPILNVLVPSITAVDVSARSVGSTLAKEIINMIEGRTYNKKIEVDYDILMKKSTNRVG